MSNITMILAWATLALPFALKLGVALGALGTALETLGGLFAGSSRAPVAGIGKTLVFFGKKLEAVGVDIPKLLDFVLPLLTKFKGPAVSMLCLSLAFMVALLLCACPPGTAGGSAGAGGATTDGGSFWPTVAHCAPKPSDVIGQVTQILLSGGDIDSELQQAAVAAGKDGAEAVICSVRQLEQDWSSPNAARNAVRTDGLHRAEAFLAAHPVHVEAQ